MVVELLPIGLHYHPLLLFAHEDNVNHTFSSSGYQLNKSPMFFMHCELNVSLPGREVVVAQVKENSVMLHICPPSSLFSGL